MKDILIIFCVLLVLLIIISTLGGSVRPSPEAFDQVQKANELAVVENYLSDPDRQEEEESTVYEHYEVLDEQPLLASGAATEQFTEQGGIVGFDGSDNFASY